jgi:nitrogen-specific signal transduction histidine kinase
MECLGPLLAEFPEPVVVTNREREVVFLNGAAQEFFGETLRAGAPCPLCSITPIMSEVGAGTTFRVKLPKAGAAKGADAKE